MSISEIPRATKKHSHFPFHVYIEGDKPYAGSFKDHPKFWLLVCIGSSLCISAGFINAIAIFDLYSYALTHLSGLTTSSAINFVKGDEKSVVKAWTFLGDIFSYGGGAAFAGFLVAANKHTLGRHFAFGFFLHGCLLLIVTWILENSVDNKFVCQFLLCFACGLQNGMTSTYSNNILRTTHITGMISDTFMLLGYWLRTRDIKADLWRWAVFIPIWVGFLTGSALGTWIYMKIGFWAFLMPAFYSWLWCGVLLMFRGIEPPIQMHLEDGDSPVAPTITQNNTTTPTPRPNFETPTPALENGSMQQPRQAVEMHEVHEGEGETLMNIELADHNENPNVDSRLIRPVNGGAYNDDDFV